MEQESINAPLGEALEELKSYFTRQLTYNKLLLSKKLSESSAGLVLFVILSGIGALTLLFLSFAFVNWYSFYFGRSIYEGYLILAGFYILLAVLVIVFRRQWIYGPLRKATGTLLFWEEDSDINEGIPPETFSSPDNLNSTIHDVREELDAQEEELKVLFERVSNRFTLRNITQHLARNAYNSFFTTANVTKAAFLLFSRIKGKKKKHKKLKK